jgi:hypothetical protein
MKLASTPSSVTTTYDTMGTLVEAGSGERERGRGESGERERG